MTSVHVVTSDDEADAGAATAAAGSGAASGGAGAASTAAGASSRGLTSTTCESQLAAIDCTPRALSPPYRGLHHHPIPSPLPPRSLASARLAAVTVSSLSVPKRALESIALQFLLAAGKHAVGPYERRVVSEFLRSGVLDLAALHLHANHGRLDGGDVAAACEGLALLAATEEFSTAKARAFTREGAAVAIASLRGDVLDKLVAGADAATKRKLRPLVDLSAEVGRRVGVK
jgi:hypothetical protein